MADTSLIFNLIAKDKTGPVFDKMRGAATVAGAAIGAALMAGSISGLESSKLNATMAAQLGAPAEIAEDLGKVAGKVYAKGVAGGLEDVNKAIKGVWQNGLVDKDATSAEIEAVTSKVVNLSKTMEEDADRVSAAVSQMLRTGMASSAEEAFNILTRGIQQGVNKSNDLLDTFNEYGTQFRKLGLDGPRAMGLLSQAIQAGARDSDVAADALKEFSIRAVDGSTTTADGFKMLGLNAKKMADDIAAGGPRASAALGLTLQKLREIKDPVLQGQAAVKLFGTQAEDLGAALYAMDPSQATRQLGDLAGAAEKAGQTLEQSAGARLEAFKRKTQAALVDQLAKAVPYIESTFGWFSRNKDWVVPLVGGLTAFAAAIYAITTAMKVWSAVQVVLNLALWTSPITWIVLGVLALVAVIVLIATKTTWFQTAWKAAWGAIQAYYSFVLNLLVTGFQTWWSVFSGFWTGVGRFFADLGGKIWGGLVKAWDWVTDKFDSMVGLVEGLKTRIGKAAMGMWDGIKNAYKGAMNWIVSKWNGLSFTIGGGSFMGMSIPSMTLSTPKLPMLARGGTALTAGAAIVGERGPELLHLPRGATVEPLSGGRGGGGAIVLKGDGTRLMALLIELLREAIANDGDGNVQTFLGGRR